MNYYSQQEKKTKIRNAFNNKMSTDLKLSKAQINKIIHFIRSVIKNNSNY